MKKHRAVIVEDVKNARELLRADLGDVCPQIEIVGEAAGVVEGAKLIRKTNPEVVFLDIQMPDGDGFDMLELLPDKQFKTIFTTASDAHALKAFKFAAADYLLKPIDKEELALAVEKAIGTHGHQERMDALKENMSQQIHKMEKIALNTHDKIHVVSIQQIIRCASDVNYTFIHLKGGERVLVTKTLKEFDEMLRPNGFIRVHQSHLVNGDHIKEFVKADGGQLNLSDGSYVPVSSRRRAAVIQALEEL